MAYSDSARVDRYPPRSPSTKVRKAVAMEDFIKPSSVGLLFLRRITGKFYSMTVLLTSLIPINYYCRLSCTGLLRPHPLNKQRQTDQTESGLIYSGFVFWARKSRLTAARVCVNFLKTSHRKMMLKTSITLAVTLIHKFFILIL